MDMNDQGVAGGSAANSDAKAAEKLMEPLNNINRQVKAVYFDPLQPKN